MFTSDCQNIKSPMGVKGSVIVVLCVTGVTNMVPEADSKMVETPLTSTIIKKVPHAVPTRHAESEREKNHWHQIDSEENHNGIMPAKIDPGIVSLDMLNRDKRGANCTLLKNCEHGGECDVHSGKCNCQAGWNGPTCDLSCLYGKYGKNCLEDCKCKSSRKTCDKVDGSCVCMEGWTGKYCDIRVHKKCPSHRYGSQCENDCKCQNYSDCDSSTGTCECNPGWNGTRCHIPCLPGTYGPNCTEVCRCVYSKSCSPKDGTCECEMFWSGPLCDKTSVALNTMLVGVAILIPSTIAIGFILGKLACSHVDNHKPKPNKDPQIDEAKPLKETDNNKASVPSHSDKKDKKTPLNPNQGEQTRSGSSNDSSPRVSTTNE